MIYWSHFNYICNQFYLKAQVPVILNNLKRKLYSVIFFYSAISRISNFLDVILTVISVPFLASCIGTEIPPVMKYYVQVRVTIL